MHLQFLGAANTVTGSQTLVTSENLKILIDCGLYQGLKDECLVKNQNFNFNPKTLSFVLLTHAHIDHSGNLPNLVKQGFNNPIFCTPATFELCKILLKDSAYIQEVDLNFINKIRLKRKLQPLPLLYTEADVNKALNLFSPMPYNKKFQLSQNVVAEFIDAGHILGSASIALEITEDSKIYKIGFTGDIGHSKLPIMNEPNKLRDINYLVTESTYGNKNHKELQDIEELIVKLVKKTVKYGGNIVIPAFAVGRVQILSYIFHKLFSENRIPEIPIYVDSPMALLATDVYNKYSKDLNSNIISKFQGESDQPFNFRRLKYIETVEESKQLNFLTFPHIIISASGMLEGGRVLHHIKNNIENRKSTILFVGFSAEHTLGRRLIDGIKRVKIFGTYYNVKCNIKNFDAFSAHADMSELVDYIAINNPLDLTKIFINHGEYLQSSNLKRLLKRKGFKDIVIPQVNEEFEL